MSEPKRRGRPPLDPRDPSVPVSLSLPATQFQALCARAQREGVGVPEIIRRDLHTARENHLKRNL